MKSSSVSPSQFKDMVGVIQHWNQLKDRYALFFSWPYKSNLVIVFLDRILDNCIKGFNLGD